MRFSKSVLTGAMAALMVVGSIGSALAVEARTTTTLNVRNGPGTWARVVDVLSPGTRVDIEECSRGGSWCYVSTRWTEGWVSASYLRRSGGGGRHNDPGRNNDPGRGHWDDDDWDDGPRHHGGGRHHDDYDDWYYSDEGYWSY
jgi:uncharacterized protein YraI